VKKLEIITNPKNNILRTECKEIVKINQKMKDLALNMMYTMKVEDGIGLAASQVGVPKRLLVFDCVEISGREHDYGILFNPHISHSEGSQVLPEGCLSLPGKKMKVERASKIVVEYKDMAGKKKQRELEELAAQVVQHEIDHLNGRLMTDYERN